MGISMGLYKSMRLAAHTADDFFARAMGNFQRADLSIFHQFAPPPSGGGHQFLRGFWRECTRRGLIVENNSISHTTHACLFNSYNFDAVRLHRLRRSSVVYVHRVDGPIDIYRGKDAGIDRWIWEISAKYADKTIFQSKYSLEKHLSLGLKFNNPIIALNAVDSTIFHSNDRLQFSHNRRIRLIASSWSDNPNKGAACYSWLDEHLDWDRYEFLFVGRAPLLFKNIKIIAPVPSIELANLLRQSDIYITASKNDPCSNSLLEALSCGNPAIYLNSGGHPEIVKKAGLSFESTEEVPFLLEKIIDQYPAYQAEIDIPSMQSITSLYLKTLELS